MSADIRAQALERLKRILSTHLAGCGARVWLFGSMATGQWNRFSEIDVAVDAGGRLPPGLRADLEEALEESTIPYHVDLMDLADADEALRASILREGVRWL